MKLNNSVLNLPGNIPMSAMNDDIIIFGESTMPFMQINDTITMNSSIKTWDESIRINNSDTDSLKSLKEVDLKSTGYKQMVDGFCDTLAVAEDMFNEEEIAKGFIEALDEQRKFYKTKENFYSNLITTIKFQLNEK